MADGSKLVVVTGAHSNLGAAVLERLISDTDYRIACLVTPWAGGRVHSGDPDRVQWHAADLTKPFDEQIAALFSEAHRVLHFAWIRGTNRKRASAFNQAIADRIIDIVRQPENFILISSTAASPRGFSTYGRTKWQVACKVRQRGGIIAMCGLVICDPPFGPEKLLHRLVITMPLALRLGGQPVPLYTTNLGDFLNAMVVMVKMQVEPNAYRVFAQEPIDLNRLLSLLESRFLRPRLPLRISVNFIINVARAVRFSGMPYSSKLADKVLSFLYKDTELLSAVSALPGTRFRSYDAL